jgi:hypothetical protein
MNSLLPPDDQTPAGLDALDSYAQEWQLMGSPTTGWTATRRRGNRTVVLGSDSARGLLERLLAFDAKQRAEHAEPE